MTLEQANALDIQIYNSIGQQIWTSSLPAAEQHNLLIPVSNYSSGLYFMQVSSDQGQITKRFVVEN